jgi:F-type H+-transporting ATPase subunit delta
MAAAQKASQQLARQLFKLSVVNGAVSAEQVAGVLAYIEKHRPANRSPCSSLPALHRRRTRPRPRGRRTRRPVDAALDAIAAP